jgi:AcrR family transcriptional regulator
MLAARDAVAARGVGASMTSIATAAEVAVGTLYRHFPTKSDLVAAVIDESVSAIASMAEDSVANVSAGSAADGELAQLIRSIAARHAVDRALKHASAELGMPVPSDPARLVELPHNSTSARAAAAIEYVLDAAKKTGRIRLDLTLADLIMLLGGMPEGDSPPQTRDRYLDIVLAGIRTGGD